jgi:hypothetical protein
VRSSSICSCPRCTAYCGPAVAGQPAARLGVDVVAVAADQRPFARLQPDGVEHGFVETQVEQLAHGVGLQVDAHAQRLQFGHGFEHGARHADLVQRQRQRQAADAAAGDQDRGRGRGRGHGAALSRGAPPVPDGGIDRHSLPSSRLGGVGTAPRCGLGPAN